MNKHLIAIAAAALLLAGCGGGADAPADTSTPAAAMDSLRTALSSANGRKTILAVTPAQAADQLMNYGEQLLPQIFPGHKTTQSFPPFLFRYYPETDTYLGVVVTAGMGYTLDHVYVVGPAFGNTLANPLDVGPVSKYITVVDPGTGPTGGNNGCFDLALLDATGTHIEIAMQHSGDATGTLNMDWTVTGPKTFEGQSAVESVIRSTGTLTAEGQATTVDTNIKNYAKRTGDAEVTDYGDEMTMTGSIAGLGTMTTQAKTVNNPPSVDKQYALALGESVTQSTTSTTTTTTTISAPGFPGQPSTTTNTSTSTMTIKFVARESVTVPAGTYSACKFETTVGGVAGLTTSWVLNGKGIPLKSVSTSTVNNTTITSTQQATSIKLNGQSL